MKGSYNTFDIVIGAMLFIVVGIMPLIVRVALRPIPPESVDVFARMPGTGIQNGIATYINVFSYWKGWFLGLPASVIAFYSVSEAVTSGIKKFDFKQLIKNPVVIVSGFFLLFVLISALFSDYTYTSWHGTVDRGEGVWIWLAYFIVFFGAMHYVREPKNAKVILWGLVFSSIIMGAVGLGQFLQRDFFATSLGEWLVAGGVEGLTDFRIRFEIAYGTLYNPNTFGLYSAMLAPVLLITAVTYDGKKIVNILLFIAGGLMLGGVLGSQSLGGFLGTAAAAGIIAITLLSMIVYKTFTKVDAPRKSSNSKIILGLTGLAVLAAIVATVIFVSPVNERFAQLRARVDSHLRVEPSPVYHYRFENETMTVYLDDTFKFSATVNRDIQPGAQLPFGITSEWITLRDSEGNIIPHDSRQAAENHTVYGFSIPRYRPVEFSLYSDHFIHNRIAFAHIDNRIVGISAAGIPIDLSQPIPAFGFHGRESWGNQRGYIFSRSFPLLPGCWLIGSGPDSYVNTFPQHDLIGKMQHMTEPYQIVDKAHNLYLQTWITTGGISALALVFLFGHYLFTTFVALVRVKSTSRFINGLRLGLLASVGAFCAASMGTDSTIGSTGVFFVLLGLGYGVNLIAKEN